MSKILVLNPFSLDSDAHSLQHSIEFLDDSLTVQADAQQADINFIVKQFGLTSELPYGLSVPEYADYSDIPSDYHAALNFVRDSDEAFLTMPADVRSRFDNDAGNFLAFVSDSSNIEEATNLGIVIPRPSTPPASDAGGSIPASDAGGDKP